MKLLRNMLPDEILAELEKRSDALLAAEQAAGEHEARFKAFEASTAIAYRDSGKSMAEAEARVRGGEQWVELYRELQDNNAKAAHAKRHYQSAVIASDLWRTESATHRNIR